jgi:hypothetical protein
MSGDRLAILETKVARIQVDLTEIKDICKSRPGDCIRGILEDRVKVWEELKLIRARQDDDHSTLMGIKSNEFIHINQRLDKLENKKLINTRSTRVKIALIDLIKYVIVALIGVAAARYIPPVG